MGTAFDAPGKLSPDGGSCTSNDGAVVVTFATPVSRTAQPQAYDVTVTRGATRCFRYQGAGSASTPATFASATTSLEMTSDSKTGELVLACDGKTWRGSLFASKCKGTGTLPSVGTSYSPGATLSMRIGTSAKPNVYSCGG